MAEKVIIGNCTLYHGDCLNIIPQISGVDVVLTDPPYGTKTDQRGESFMVGEFSNVLPIALPLLHTTMKPDGSFYCFTSWAQMSEWLLRFQQYFKLQNILVWDKKRHSGCYSPSSWQFTWEGVFYGIKGKRKIRKYLRDVLVSAETGKRVAMQKPVDILVQMIEASCDEGDLIFDPFMGSGSSGVAAVKSGRRFVGIEINREIFDLACRRIEQAYAQLRLFEDAKVGAGDTENESEKMNGLQKAHYDNRSIRIEKLSPITDTGCVCEDVLRLLGKPTNRWDSIFSCEPIGNNVWRAKVGKRGEWGYGRSIDDSLNSAFEMNHNAELTGRVEPDGSK